MSDWIVERRTWLRPVPAVGRSRASGGKHRSSTSSMITEAGRTKLLEWRSHEDGSERVLAEHHAVPRLVRMPGLPHPVPTSFSYSVTRGFRVRRGIGRVDRTAPRACGPAARL